MKKSQFKRLLNDFFDAKSLVIGGAEIHKDALENSRFVARAIPPYTGGWLIYDRKEGRFMERRDVVKIGRERLLNERLENH